MLKPKTANITEERQSLKSFLLLILIAYLFSVGIRFIWVDYAAGIDSFHYNNEIMINTNDGYFFAEGARDILAGGHEPNDLSAVDYPLSKLTALLASLLPVSFETLILYMPAFIGSLLVVPVMLIARVLKIPEAGFAAAMLGAITWSYYNRTMIGYYDTDMLVIVLPTFILWSMVLSVSSQRNRHLLLIPVFMMLYTWWYPSSYTLNMGFTVMMAIYTLLFERRNLFNYKVLIFMLLALSMTFWWLKLLIAAALFALFHFKKELVTQKTLYLLLGLAIILVLVTGGLGPVLHQVKGYIFREAYAADIGLNFFAVNQTVREAGQIPFEVFANRISGHTLTFMISLVGYALLLWRYRVMMLSLPMAVLGFIALFAGLRFTVYAVPIMALGLGYLIVLVAGSISKKRVMRYGIGAVMLAAVLYPNVAHIVEYRVPTVFNTEEVKLLDKLKSIATREDYVVTWWDYGYPIRYYSDVKTLIDGAKHSGQANFPVSFALTQNQIAGSNMARLDVEYTERSYSEGFTSNLPQMLKEHNTSNINAFLGSLDADGFMLPEKTRDVYFFLPDRMLSIFPTVGLFSNLDLQSGEQKSRPLFYSTMRFSDQDGQINLGNAIVLDKQKSVIHLGKQQVPLARFIITSYSQEGVLQKKNYNLHPEGLSAIYMQSHNRIVILDEEMFNSLYVQLYILENYDASRFEPVILSPYAKIYRLKV